MLFRSLGDIYPEIVKNRKVIEIMLQEEEAKFHETIHRGMGVIEEAISRVQTEKKTVLAGEIAFKLYDTYGFSLDLTQDALRLRKIDVDTDGFNAAMERQRAEAAQHSHDQR